MIDWVESIIAGDNAFDPVMATEGLAEGGKWLLAISMPDRLDRRARFGLLSAGCG